MRHSSKRVKKDPAPEFFYWRNPVHEVTINESRAIIYDWDSPLKDYRSDLEGKEHWFFCPYVGTICGEEELLDAVSLIVNDGMASRYAVQEDIAGGIWYGLFVPRGTEKASEDEFLEILKKDIHNRRCLAGLD